MEINKIVPKNMLLLYSPWLKQMGKVIGAMKASNPDLYQKFMQCNYENEFKGETPIVVDRFLAWENKPKTFKSKTRPRYNKHRHDLSHEHPVRNVSANGPQIIVDLDNGGSREVVSPTLHEHGVSLTKQYVGVDSMLNESEPIINEPEHREVNGYYTKEDVEIPLGTITFYIGRDQPDGWRDLNILPIDYDPSDDPSTIRRRLWRGVFFKISSCWPAPNQRGLPTHYHTGASHDHRSLGTVEYGQSKVIIDYSKKPNTKSALWYHNHNIANVDNSIDFVGEGDSAPWSLIVRPMV